MEPWRIEFADQDCSNEQQGGSNGEVNNPTYQCMFPSRQRHIGEIPEGAAATSMLLSAASGKRSHHYCNMALGTSWGLPSLSRLQGSWRKHRGVKEVKGVSIVLTWLLHAVLMGCQQRQKRFCNPSINQGETSPATTIPHNPASQLKAASHMVQEGRRGEAGTNLVTLLPFVEVARGQQLEDMVPHLIIADEAALKTRCHSCVHPVPVVIGAIGRDKEALLLAHHVNPGCIIWICLLLPLDPANMQHLHKSSPTKCLLQLCKLAASRH